MGAHSHRAKGHTTLYDLAHLIPLGLVAFCAGIINSIAGGGSLLTFPTLIAFGMPALTANATNTAAVWPGTLSSVYAYRRDFPSDRALAVSLFAASVLGGVLGALVLVRTPPALFIKLTPFLVLFGTLVFAARAHISARVKKMAERANVGTGWGRAAGFAFQFLVATYGGYFGAGAGLLMLGALGLMGIRDIHSMNAIKTALASLFNGIALLLFALSGLVVWPVALVMGGCNILGGYVGAKGARRLNQQAAGRVIVVLGFAAALWLFAKAYL